MEKEPDFFDHNKPENKNFSLPWGSYYTKKKFSENDLIDFTRYCLSRNKEIKTKISDHQKLIKEWLNHKKSIDWNTIRKNDKELEHQSLERVGIKQKKSK